MFLKESLQVASSLTWPLQKVSCASLLALEQFSSRLATRFVGPLSPETNGLTNTCDRKLSLHTWVARRSRDRAMTG